MSSFQTHYCALSPPLLVKKGTFPPHVRVLHGILNVQAYKFPKTCLGSTTSYNF